MLAITLFGAQIAGRELAIVAVAVVVLVVVAWFLLRRRGR